MSKKWRPEHWYNPHLYFGSPRSERDDASNARHEVYEAGAEAMLEAILARKE